MILIWGGYSEEGLKGELHCFGQQKSEGLQFFSEMIK